MNIISIGNSNMNAYRTPEMMCYFCFVSVVDEGIVPGPERASDEIVLSLSKAIGVSFAFILVGAFLPLIAVAMYVCCASRSDSHSFK